jgi:CHAT domain-containing protein
MTSPTAAPGHILISRGLTVLLLLVLAGAAVGLLNTIPPQGSETTLLRDLSEIRPGGGRLFRAAAIPYESARYKKAMARAEVTLLSMPDSSPKRRLQALVDAGKGKFQQASKNLEALHESDPQNVELLNDLGVLYLALGAESAVNYFRAMELFERARELAPGAAAPRFNTVLAYRSAGIKAQADLRLDIYRQMEMSSFWARELSIQPPTDLELVENLRRHLADHDTHNAIKLIQRSPDDFREIGLSYALNPPNDNTFDTTFEFILNTLKDASDDRTIEAILTPLSTTNRERILSARVLTREGIKAYQQSRVGDSLRFYDLADAAAKDSGSLFDELWIELNRADLQIRVVNIKDARPLVEDVIARSQKANLLWLLAQALTSKGSSSVLTGTYGESVRTLNEAVNIFAMVGTPRAIARPLNYVAMTHSIAGDFESSLQIATQALRLTQADDHVRLAQLYWVSALQLYRLGFVPHATQLQEHAVTQAEATGNPVIVSAIAPYLAMIHVARNDYAAALDAITRTNAALGKIQSSRERDLNDLASNLLCGRIGIGRGNPSAAEECLERNMEILSREPVKIPVYFAQTLLLLSEVHALQGQVEQARQKLREAIEIVEDNDAYLAGNSLRVSFENERRNTYDLAIGFEYDHDGHDAAWSYLQRYRSKLFLEFLKQTTPGVATIHSEAIRRDKVQQLLPQDVQVVEYAMSGDRLLIWLVSNNTFKSVSVPVARSELEKKVSTFLEQTQDKAELEQQAAELHRLLIDPIEDQLDPRRALAIIPDQALHRLNFPALYSASRRSYLIQRYTLLESPSLTSLLSAGAGSPGRSNVVAFGAQSDDTQATRELVGVQQLYRNTVSFNGPTALRPSFLSSLASAGVLHYAGHSQDASDPLRSSILLDGNREGSNSVTAADIAARRMPANSVVVLASCDSSVGNSRDGLGVRGLTSAFLISGAGSVVGSLWLVEAESTSRLVLAFHRSFARDRVPVADALRNAQLQAIAGGSHPYYWSGFVVTGNLSALR